MQFRARPNVVDAIRLTRESRDECLRFCPAAKSTGSATTLEVRSILGTMLAMDGDWIVRPRDGGQHVVLPNDVFWNRYEHVEQETT